MKKYFIILTGIALIACANSTGDNKAANLQASATPSAESKTAESADADGCGKQLFFKKGIVMEATTFQGDGTVTRKDKTKIIDVRSEGEFTVAEAESTEITEGKKNDKVMHYTYKCDGKSFYVDLSQLMGQLDTKGAKIDVSNVAFPINIKEGDKLPEASITMNMSYGKKTMKTKVTYKDRKVEGTEELKINGGLSFKCYKVSAILDTEMEGLDDRTKQMMETMKARQPKMKSVMWYAPDAGILRFDLYMGESLKSYSQLTAVKN